MAEWRTGRKVGRTIYRDEVLVGVMDTPELAAEVVAALRAVGRLLGSPCGHTTKGVLDAVLTCTKSAGHEGAHGDASGCEWLELYDCGARPECAEGCAGRAQGFQCVRLNTGMVTTARLKS